MPAGISGPEQGERGAVPQEREVCGEKGNDCDICPSRDWFVHGGCGDAGMKVIRATHRQENGRTIVNLLFKTQDQLLDPDDPSPLHIKELTQEAEDAILDNVFAAPLKKPLTLEIQVQGAPGFRHATEITDAVRHHFRFVLNGHERDTAIFIRERRTALAFTAFNLLIGLLYAGYSYQHEDWMNSVTGKVLGGVIIIMNWATIWDTYEYFIFDGREKRQRKKLLQKILDAEIHVIPSARDI